MVGHFECIGFEPVTVRESVPRALGGAPRVAQAPGGSMHYLARDASGAAIAFHMQGDAVECVTPFFVPDAGLHRWHVHTSAPAIDAECIHCSGADCDIVDAQGELLTRTGVQFAIFRPYEAWLTESRTFDVEVVGFAHTMSTFATKEEFDEGQRELWTDEDGKEATGRDGRPLRYADNVFMPEGLFSAGPIDMRARAISLCAGRITHARRLVNGWTNGPFWHVTLETFPGPLDIVAADVEPTVGHLALVRAWLVGRPTTPPPRPSWLRRLFN